MKHTRKSHTSMSRKAATRLLVAPLVVMGALAVGSPAHAQEPDTAGAGDVVLQCSQFFGADVPGTIVFTPSGNFNANCNPYAPPPSGAGGAVVVKCADVFGEGVAGHMVMQPNGHFKGHCR